MKILIDTNIIIDNFARRDEYGESLKILSYCENGVVEGIITTVTVMDAMYVLKKYLDSSTLRNAMFMLLQIVDVVPALKSDINTALTGDFKDFENAVQASCASRNKIDYIVTRNVNDFGTSVVKALSPEDMICLLQD